MSIAFSGKMDVQRVCMALGSMSISHMCAFLDLGASEPTAATSKGRATLGHQLLVSSNVRAKEIWNRECWESLGRQVCLHLIVMSAFSRVDTHADADHIGKPLPQYSSYHATSVFSSHCHKSELTRFKFEHVCHP